MSLATSIARWLYDGTTNRSIGTLTAGQLLKATASGITTVAGRELLTANRTYYVRTDGSDSNTGLVDSAGGAFLTLQKAVDTVAGLDLGIYDVTIDVGNGTYTGGCKLKTTVGGGTVHLLGDTTTPSNVVISPTSATCFGSSSESDDFHGKYTIRGFRMTTTTSGACIDVGGNCTILMSACQFSTVPAGWYHIASQRGAAFRADGNYSIIGGGGFHWIASRGAANIVARTLTITITGTPAFGFRFADATEGGIINCGGNTYSGSATGARHLVNTAGGIITGGVTLPGDSAGTTTSPGWIT